MSLRATSNRKDKPHTRRFLANEKDEFDYRTAPDLQDEFADEDKVSTRKSKAMSEPGYNPATDGDEKNAFVLKELGQVAPPDYPFRWNDRPEEERPKSPFDEYVRNVYPLTLEMLAIRWQGLFTLEDIQQEAQFNDWRTARFKYRAMVDRTALGTSLATDAEFRKMTINRSIVRLSSYLDTVDADIESGYEYDKSSAAGALGYVRRPLGVKSKTALISAAIAIDNALMTRVGVATQIHESSVNVKIGAVRTVRDFLGDNDEEYRKLQEITGKVNSRFASDAPVGLAVRETGEEEYVFPPDAKLFEVAEYAAASGNDSG